MLLPELLETGFIGSKGLKLRFAAKRGIELFHFGPKSCNFNHNQTHDFLNNAIITYNIPRVDPKGPDEGFITFGIGILIAERLRCIHIVQLVMDLVPLE